MNISSSYNPDKGCISIRLNTNLLEKYYLNLKGLIQNSQVKVLGICKESSDVMIIDFPVIPGTTTPMSPPPQSPAGTMGVSVGVDKDQFGELINIINKFVEVALKRELKTIEFCPLEGYSLDLLKKDLVVAQKAKRNLMFIDTYQSYLDTEKSNASIEKYVYNQYEVTYGSDEWAEAMILINTDRFDELRKWIRPLLKKVAWV